MPRIVFTADPKLPADLKHLGYKKDTEVDLPDDQCHRWIRRGVAQFVSEKPRAKVVEAAALPADFAPSHSRGPSAPAQGAGHRSR